jgi:hypothetical protein
MNTSDPNRGSGNPSSLGGGPNINIVRTFVAIIVLIGLAMIILGGISANHQNASNTARPPAATSTGSAPAK